MTESKMKLTREQYEDLNGRSYKEVAEWVKSRLPGEVVYGYGYYGCTKPYIDEEGNPCIKYSIGSSCD